MKRLYFAAFLMIAAAQSLFAQLGVMDLDTLKNDKCYFIEASASSRGRWVFNPEEPTTLYSTSRANVEPDYTQPNQQFAILKSSRRGLIYFYSVGGKKFLNGPGDQYVYLTDTPVSARNTIIKSSDGKQASGPWVCCDGSHQFNMSRTTASGVLSNWNDINDEGNAVRIVEVDDFDPTDALAKIDAFEQTFAKVTVHYEMTFNGEKFDSYDQQQLVNLNENATFDTPRSYFALKATTEQKAAMTITDDVELTVTYEYAINGDDLPFELESESAEAFSENTPLYFMTVKDNTTYMFLNEGDGSFTAQTSKTHPLSRNALFSFSGDPIHGFQIHSYGTDDIILTMFAKEEDWGEVYMSEEGSRFVLEHNNSNGYQFNLATDKDRSAYLSIDEGGIVQTYDYQTYGRDLDVTTFNFTKLTPNEAEMIANGIEALAIDSVYPAPGNFIGEIDEIQVFFTGNLTSINGDNRINIYDKKGNLYASVVGVIDNEYPNCLDILLDTAMVGNMNYTVSIPEMTVYGADNSQALNQTLDYKVIIPFEPLEGITGRIWNKALTNFLTDNAEVKVAEKAYGGLAYNNDGYVEVKVDVPSQNEIIVYAFDGTEGNNLDVVFDNDLDWGDVQKVNGVGRIDEGNGIYWTIPSDLMDDSENWGYFWFYPDTNNGGCVGHVSVEQQYGILCMSFYDYLNYGYYTLYIDFYLDDRYAESEEDGVSSIAAQTKSKTTGVYNLAGQRMGNRLTKGIYIKDGKKIVVK